MSENEHQRQRPPLFPPELLAKGRNRPRAVLAAEKYINDTVDKAVKHHLLDLAATLQQRISEAIALIDAGRIADARALLDRQVIALDSLPSS